MWWSVENVLELRNAQGETLISVEVKIASKLIRVGVTVMVAEEERNE